MDFLKRVLAGFEMQTEKSFEIIISDDGSDAHFVAELNRVIQQTPLSITHQWQEDAGFRKNKILNKSVLAAKANYLIFSDGDCIPHPAFVSEHLAAAENKVCLAGRRVDLSERITKLLSPEKIKAGFLQSSKGKAMMLQDFLRARLFHFMNGFYTKNKALRRFFNRKERGLLGANFSLHKQDLLEINGFDERYNAPTFGEDSDVELRLRMNGVAVKTVMNIAVQYHCHHSLLPRPESSLKLYRQAIKEARPFTPFGIIK